MSANGLPATVGQFVQGHFDSVTAVEVLLFLERERAISWNSEAVARSLRIDADQTRGILNRLQRAGFVRRKGSEFQYGPRTGEVADEVEVLAGVYPRYKLRISRLIFSNQGPWAQSL